MSSEKFSPFLGSYPTTRLRRNRQAEWTRRLVAETTLAPHDLIWPVFLREKESPSGIPSMPGVKRFTVDELLHAAEEAASLGISALALFPYVESYKKCAKGQEAFNEDNIICQAVRALRKENLPLGLIADVALDPYTSHGHDGVMGAKGHHPEYVLNDETIEALVCQAMTLAEAGIDAVAPSDMMDGRIGVIRQALDKNGFDYVQIISYAAKYASAFYGPFRDAVGSKGALKGGSKATYQMDPANSDEALREVAQDIQEGADMIIVKPGLPYLDIIRRVEETFSIPTFAYQVSGEYSVFLAAAEKGWLDLDRAIMESLLSFKRAGAEGVFTYFAPRAAAIMRKQLLDWSEDSKRRSCILKWSKAS